MKAYWLANSIELTEQELGNNGLEARQHVDATNDLAEIMTKFGCQSHDTVRISDKTPNIHNLLASFQEEHCHSEDEIRLLTEGSAIFDVRSLDDRWIRIEVSEGDLLQVPAMRYHRFFATGLNQSGTPIEAVRLFKTKEGWTPIYRKDVDEN